ncbi:MAG: 6-phosphogluconolactonase [Sodalis sp. Psp]|nr:6-phosphogluconolactonase [Sodalis sp. Psp]
MKQIVYVANPESQQIHVWKMNNQGMLTLLQVVDTPGQGQPMAIHPVKMHLYVGVRPTYGVVSYRIDERGMLTEAGRMPLPSSPTYLTTNLHGKNLYCVSYSGNCLNVSPIDKNGIAGTPTQTLEGLSNCHSVNVDTINQVLWVPCLKEDRIRLYHIGRLGHLTSYSPTAIESVTGAGPRHMVFHPGGGYAYVINEFHGTVNVIAIDPAGSGPRIVQTLDIMPADFSSTRWAADIHLTPDGCWLYCCDRTASILSQFAVLKDGGALNLIGHYETETQPRGFNIDMQGRFLVAAGQKSNYIAVYSIAPQTGKLTPLERYAVGQGPAWVSILAR